MRVVRIAACSSLTLTGCISQPQLHGPMPVRNQHPAQLTVLHLPPSGVTALPAGELAARADAAYSSLWLNGSAPGRSWTMDGEYLRVATTLRVGLGGGFELAGELPVAHTSGGFLDDFLVQYHDLLGLPDQGRDTSPRDEFEIAAQQNGQAAWSVESSSLELMDIPLSLGWQLADPAAGLGVAVRGGIELPTGDDQRGYGNGEVDWSLGLLLEHHAGGVGWYGHLQHTFAGTPDQAQAAGLDFADVTSMGLGSELPLAEDFSALVQVEYETSTLRELDLQVVAREQFLLWVGGRLRVADRWGLELGFGEDLAGLVSPDFTAWFGFTTLAPRRAAP